MTYWGSINKYALFEDFRKDAIDLIPLLGDKNIKKAHSIKTDTISSFNYAIVTDSKGTFSNDIEDIFTKVIALPFGSAAYTYIKKYYPKTVIIETENY